MKRSPTLWYRANMMGTPLPVFKQAIKDRFMANAALTDLRAVDRLVYESQMIIRETEWHVWNVEHLENRLMKSNLRKAPADFLSKFFAGKS